jgi:hypothetical protein
VTSSFFRPPPTLRHWISWRSHSFASPRPERANRSPSFVAGVDQTRSYSSSRVNVWYPLIRSPRGLVVLSVPRIMDVNSFNLCPHRRGSREFLVDRGLARLGIAHPPQDPAA